MISVVWLKDLVSNRLYGFNNYAEANEFYESYEFPQNLIIVESEDLQKK